MAGELTIMYIFIAFLLNESSDGEFNVPSFSF